MDKDSPERACDRLEELQEFPCAFPFKFIVPAARAQDAVKLFPEGSAKLRSSSGGKYVSVSADLHMESADEVRAIYNKACAIPGLLAL